MSLLQQTVSSLPSFSSGTNVPYIFDQYGRARIFHGTNFIRKGFPWYTETLLEEENVAKLAAMGMNTVRLSLQWTGAQPTEDAFDMTYYEITNQIINNLVKYDIIPFLDVHQDVMSTYFCLYDGFPTWAVDKMSATTHEFPWPLKPGDDGSVCPWTRGWAQNYFSEGASVAFQSLYDANSPMQEAFGKFWQFSAQYFADKPILGYEIINEPWAGNLYANPDLLLPGHAGAKNLQPFYDTIVAKIREKDPNRLIFYEPVTWGMIFNGDVLGSGFDHVPGGEAYQNQSVFSFHYYCWWYNPDTADDFIRKSCDEVFGPKVFEQVLRDTKQTGGAAMLTEWGQACDFDHENPSNATGECNAIMALCDQHFISWTDWYFGGHLQENAFAMTDNAFALFSRTYAKAIAGRPIKMNYDVTNHLFDLCFEQLEASSGAATITEIFVPFATHYPNGIEITTTPNLKVKVVDETKNLVQVQNHRVQEVNTACVHLVPKTEK